MEQFGAFRIRQFRPSVQSARGKRWSTKIPHCLRTRRARAPTRVRMEDTDALLRARARPSLNDLYDEIGIFSLWRSEVSVVDELVGNTQNECRCLTLAVSCSLPNRSTFSPTSLAYASDVRRRCSRSRSTVATIPSSCLAILLSSFFSVLLLLLWRNDGEFVSFPCGGRARSW